jgi:antitoxin component YwqK of YwqJK toxin-antitoxin module
MEDIICVHLAPLCPRLWRDLACLNKSINARLRASELTLSVAKRILRYTSCAITYTITQHGIKHGSFELIDFEGKQVAAGNYRLGLLHGELTTSGQVKRIMYYYNGRLHGLFKINARGNRETSFKHGVLHGEQRWEVSYYGIGTRVCISNYVDGIIHGGEESFVRIGDKVYPYFSRTYNMGKLHGRSRIYYINTDDLDNIYSQLAFDVEYNDGKIENIYKTSGGPMLFKWVHKYNKTYIECWQDGQLQNTGDASLGGYIDGVVMSNTKGIDIFKANFETRFRNQNGFYMSYFDNTNSINRLYMVRQFIVHGTDMIFNAIGKVIATRNVVDGYLHGVSKRYYYDEDSQFDIETNNYLFDHNLGKHVSTTITPIPNR